MSYKVYLTKLFTFEAAHNLPNYEGACANMHGHSYKLEVKISGTVNRLDPHKSIEGMVIDFKVLKKIVKSVVISEYDHAYLNNFYDVPTAELMVIGIYYNLSAELEKYGVKLESVKLWETADSCAEYKGEEVT